MENNLKPGINFTTDEETGEIICGVHISTFAAYFTPKANANGWINFTIKKNEQPVKGYSHFFQLYRKTKV